MVTFHLQLMLTSGEEPPLLMELESLLVFLVLVLLVFMLAVLGNVQSLVINCEQGNVNRVYNYENHELSARDSFSLLNSSLYCGKRLIYEEELPEVFGLI